MLTIRDAAAALRRREVSSVELVGSLLQRTTELDGRLGAYLARFDERALDAARRADADFRGGVDRGPLQGIPLGLKDILLAAEGPTTAQSRMVKPGWSGGIDATAVARLRAAGAVITGKLTLAEFAVGLPGPEVPYPVPHNPWDLDCWPGVSSSGTGVAVAAGLVLGGLGTDTGGSIRLPAAMCGVTGLKPTFGRVSTAGCIPLAPSLDHVGPMARTAWDCAAILQATAGPDAADPTCAPEPVPDYLGGLDGSLRGIRVGVGESSEFAMPPVPEVAAALATAVETLGSLGATTTTVPVPHYRRTHLAQRVVLRAESFAVHRRTLQSRWDDYSVSTRRRLAAGAFVTADDYLAATGQRALTRDALVPLFRQVDVIAMPTFASTVLRYSYSRALDEELLQAASMTAYWSLLGYPALSLPVGFDQEGLPLSMQLVARPFDEVLLLKVGDAFQRSTGWHQPEPELRSGGRGPDTRRPRSAALPDVDPRDAQQAGTLLALAGVTAGRDENALVRAYLAQRTELAELRESAAVGPRMAMLESP
jgi:aspartyl-tRNA(Asn)/glutamyl-tRNA(Gln) amidotransferase subunit A